MCNYLEMMAEIIDCWQEMIEGTDLNILIKIIRFNWTVDQTWTSK